MTPRATVRLQLHKDYTLDDARAQVDYHAALGISHYYLSPIFTARPGSTHGYDVIDFTRINPELGGEEALARLVEALRANGMGLVIDIVPNHMGVGAGMGGGGNAWWLDVLARGKASAWANFFDIDWTAPGLGGKLLLPILGQPYGEALEAGELKVGFDGPTGRFEIQVYESRLPLSPECEAALLQQAGGIVDGKATDASKPDAVIAAHDATTPEGLAALHALLERQHYRLAWWRTAADAINWRRFFEITDLAGLRMERPAVFEAVHALTFRLYREGMIDGVRVDHVDGLADPAAYCEALRARLTALHAERPAHLREGEPWIVLEKILADDERLRAEWPVDGTTGYEFMNDVAGVLHDPDGETPLTALWNVTLMRTRTFADEAILARRQILAQNLDSEFNALVRRLVRLAQSSWRTRDITGPLIQRALEALLDHVPVYRTYMTAPGTRAAEDEALMQKALTAARSTLRAADHVALNHLNEWLGCRALTPDAPPTDDTPATALASRAIDAAELTAMQSATVTKFQQLTSPLAAKAVEDTAFYRYGRLLSLNEVGGDPGRFGLPVDGFHARMQEAQRTHPNRLLATATHDHKRGEDGRARLAVLSERPQHWAEAVGRWRLAAADAGLRKTVDGHPAPSPADELMLYQALVGAWPIGLEADDAEGVAALVELLLQWQEKALREAKLVSSWVAPNADYEAACHDYLRGLAQTPVGASDQGALDDLEAVVDEAQLALADAQAADPALPAPTVLAELAAFIDAIGPAAAVNSLTQTLLRLTVPGVPDLYQGTELWDWSLVDPDNRRPVDYAARRESLHDGASDTELLQSWQDGRIKQATVHRVLAFRADSPALFAEGDYLPLAVDGPKAAHVIAFARRFGDEAVIVVGTRLSCPLLADDDLPLVGADVWGDTAVVLSNGLAEIAGWRDRLTRCAVPGATARLPVAGLLGSWPIGVFVGGGAVAAVAPARSGTVADGDTEPDDGETADAVAGSDATAVATVVATAVATAVARVLATPAEASTAASPSR